MPEIFSYERDVAPLAGSYFKRLESSGLRPEAQAMLYQSRVKGLESNFSEETQARAKAMEFERAKLLLEDARSKSYETRLNMSALGDIQEQLAFTLDNTPKEDIKLELNKLRVKLGPSVELNPVAKSMFDSIQKNTTSRADNTSSRHADKIFEGLGSVKLATGFGNDSDQFEDAGSSNKVSRVITNFATEEEKAQAANAPASVQLDIALAAQARYDAAKLQGGDTQTQTQSPRDLFK